jgi:hypothetical protein
MGDIGILEGVAGAGERLIVCIVYGPLKGQLQSRDIV